MDGFNGTSADRQPLEILQLSFKSRRLGYFRNNSPVPVDMGALAVVSVDRGEDLGRVVAKKPPGDVAPEEIEGSFLRLPTREDTELYADNREFGERVLEHCRKRVQVRNLDMRLTDCEVQLDRNRIRIFFTADQRTDFRGLVRDMASTFRARIEMRQIGVRDDAKHKDGVGICGRRLCCAGFLDDFKSVTLKSVRDQGLSPNPAKVSGACSRLMCCLEYETELYRRAAKAFPREGSRLKLAGEQVTVKKCDIFLDNVHLLTDDNREGIIDIEEFHRRRTMPQDTRREPPLKKEPAIEPEPPQKKPLEAKTGDGKKPAKKQGKGRRRHRRKKSGNTERKN